MKIKITTLLKVGVLIVFVDHVATKMKEKESA